MLTFPFGPLRWEPDFYVPTLNSFTWTEFESGMVVYTSVHPIYFRLQFVLSGVTIVRRSCSFGFRVVIQHLCLRDQFTAGSRSCRVVPIFRFHDLTVKFLSVIRDCRNPVTKLVRRGEHVGSLRIRRVSHNHCWKHLEES